MHAKSSSTYSPQWRLLDCVFLVCLYLHHIWGATPAFSSAAVLQIEGADGEQAILLCSEDPGAVGTHVSATSERVMHVKHTRSKSYFSLPVRYTFSEMLSQEIPKLRRSIQDQSNAELTVSVAASVCGD